MLAKLLKKDIKKNIAISITLCLFITMSSLLVSGALSIISETSVAMDHFFDKAKPLHYMQMVSIDVDQPAIDDFSSSNDLVEAQQTLELLGVDNSKIYYGDRLESYMDSVMENSFVTQSPSFDFLLDEKNNPVDIKPGEVAAPLYAIDSYKLKLGDTITIKDGNFDIKLKVVSFVRDSQMNPSLVSSKRFVVSKEDYINIKANTGEIEYLIEFLLTDTSKTGEFEEAYLAAGLPSGIAITLSIIKLINAMTGGLAAVVLILASILLILIALICLRFTILATLEEEYHQIGVMKAIGLAPKHIRKLYKAKYSIFGIVSCGIGYFLSLAFSYLFTKNVAVYMGKAQPTSWAFILPLLGAIVVFGIIIGFCTLVLRKLRKVTVVDALRGMDKNENKGRKAFPLYKFAFRNVNVSLGARDVINRARNYMMPIFTFTICTFLIIVPINFLNTLKSPDFVKYTGIGYSDVIMTLRHSDNIEERYKDVLKTLSTDKDVSSYAERVTANYKTLNPDGKYENISIQNGDFTKYPVDYLEGDVPIKNNEIALSLLNAKNFKKRVGDTIDIVIKGKDTRLIVSGIYQDLTNGGKSAQAHLLYSPEDVLWYTVFLNLKEDVDIATKIESYNEIFAPTKAISIEHYMSQTFSSTINQFEIIAWVVSISSIGIAVLITMLFIKHLLAKDHRQIIILKGLGFTSGDIQAQYVTGTSLCILLGVSIGTFVSGTLGEALIGLLMNRMGAAKIVFIVNPIISYILCPILLLSVVLIATVVSTHSIHKYKNYSISE